MWPSLKEEQLKMQNKLFNHLFKDKEGKYTLSNKCYKTLAPVNGGFTSLWIDVKYDACGFNIDIYLGDKIVKSLFAGNTNLAEMDDKEKVERIERLRKPFISAVEEVIKTTDFNKIYKMFRFIRVECMTTFIMNEMLDYTHMIPTLNELSMIHAQFNLVPNLIMENIKKEINQLNTVDLIVSSGHKILPATTNYKKQIITTSNGGKE